MHAFTNNMTLFCVSQSAVFTVELRLYNACVYNIGIADDVLHNNYYNVKIESNSTYNCIPHSRWGRGTKTKF